MAPKSQRIAPITWGGASTWDVHFEIKDGPVDLKGEQLRILRHLYHGTDYKGPGKALPPGLTWVESMRGCLKKFQEHIEGGTSVFYKVDSLHFLKLSLGHKKVKEGGTEKDRYFFCFSTQFSDPNEDEQQYIDDMFGRYEALMIPVWLHCKGVTRLRKYPKGGKNYELWEEFLKLVDKNKIDTTDSLCFYVANPNVTPGNIKSWEVDSVTLGDVTAEVAKARVALQSNALDHKQILDTLMTAFDDLEV
jgi:hypothetical protein